MADEDGVELNSDGTLLLQIGDVSFYSVVGQQRTLLCVGDLNVLQVQADPSTVVTFFVVGYFFFFFFY